MYANVRDPPMLKSYFANYFENPKAYSTKITVGNALKTSEAAEWIAAMKRFLEKTSPIQRVRDAKIVFEESVDDSSEPSKAY